LYFGSYSAAEVTDGSSVASQDIFDNRSSISSLASYHHPNLGGSSGPERLPKGWNQYETSSQMLSDVAVVPEGEEDEDLPDLLCEECESNMATLHCEACEETLCHKCSDLLHLKYCNGEPHDHIAENKLRKLRRGDAGAVAKPEKDPNDIPDWEVDEAEHVVLGRDITRSTAIEAPRINAISDAGKMGAIPKFKDGCRVLFACDDVEFEDDSEQAIETGWRGREAYGMVMGGPIPRHGTCGAPFRRSEENEIYYRVRVIGFASEDYAETLVYEEARRRATFEGVTIKGKIANAPLAKERQRGIAIDRKLRQVKDSKVPERYELGKNEGDPLETNLSEGESDLDNDEDKQENNEGVHRVLLLAESALKDPMEVYQGLEAQRKRGLRSVMEGLDWRCSFLTVRYRFEVWYAFSETLRFLDWSAAAVKVQTRVRSFLAKAKLKYLQDMELIRQHEMWEEFHAPYKYIWDPREQRNGFTVDGIHFFATRAENNNWCRMWMKIVARTYRLHVRADAQSVINAWRRWVKQIPEYDMDSEEDDDEDTVDGTEMDKSVTKSFTDMSSLASVLSRKNAPWHPALGMELPELPKIWARRGADGALHIEIPTKFNSFKANMAGPTDTSNWVAPGLVLMGAYPEGQAKKVGKRLIHTYPESVNQILLADVGTFVCLMEDLELREVEKEYGIDEPLSESLEKTYDTCRQYLQQSLQNAKTELFKAQQEVKHAPRYQPHDMRYPEAMIKLRKLRASERLCLQSLDRIKRAIVRFPMNPRFIHFPIPDNDTVATEELQNILLRLEHLVRDEGECLYIFSRLGHGRAGLVAGCLLGRLYGLAHEDVLERLQICHDSRTLLTHEPSKISCPQTLSQVATLREILRGTDVLYSDLKKVTGFPNADERRELIRRKERGVGVPKEANTTEILRIVPPDDHNYETDSDPEWEQDFVDAEFPPEVIEAEDLNNNAPDHHKHEENNKDRHCSVCHHFGYKNEGSSTEEDEIESDLDEDEGIGQQKHNAQDTVLLTSISEPSLRTLRAPTSFAEYKKPIARRLQISRKKTVLKAKESLKK